MNYTPNHCNIPGCTKNIHRNYMCIEHYNYYLSDPSCRKISDEVTSIQNGEVSKLTFLKLLRDFIVHHCFNLPVYRCEHFPLEHVYIWCMRHYDKRDKEKCEKVIRDFDIPENENTSFFKRLVDAANIDKTSIKPLTNYLLSKKELIACWPLLISLIAFICIYVQLRILNEISMTYFDMTYTQTIDFYLHMAPYIISLIIVMYVGTKLSTHYNNIASRAYNLDMFDKIEDNISKLNQVLYVKEGNLRNSSYFYSVFGSFIGLILYVLWMYFNSSSFSLATLLLTMLSLCVVLPLIWVYNQTVLYFPVFEAMKRKQPKIKLYNADHNGGLETYQSFMFHTFVYNEGIIVILIGLFGVLHHWFFHVILCLCLINRANHAGWSLMMYINSIIKYNKIKRYEKEQLTLSQSQEAFDKAEKLDRVYASKISDRLFKFTIVFAVPYLINHIDDIWKWLVTNIPKVCDYIDNIALL